MGPCVFPVLGIPPPSWNISQQFGLEAAFSSDNTPTSNCANPEIGTDNPPYPGENIQMVDTEVSSLYVGLTDSTLSNQVSQAVQVPFHTVSPPSVQQSTVPSEPDHPCQWPGRNEGGKFCGEKLTRKSVPEHLAERHGIKDMPRNISTECKWAGCNKMLNRESMTRHTREVHMRIKRPSNSKARAHRLNTG